MHQVARASPKLAPLAIFNGAYLLTATVQAVRAGNREFAFYLVMMVVLCATVLAVHARVRLTAGTLWALSVWGLAHMAGGLVVVPESWPVSGPHHVLYSWWLLEGWLKYDQVVHAYGFAVTTWVCWQGLCAALPAARPTLGVLVLCAAAGMGFGALNEVIEFSATLLVPDTNVGGYENTGWDLVSNLVGAVGAALGIRLGLLAGGPAAGTGARK